MGDQSGAPQRLLLRAEVRHQARSFIGHTIEIADEWIFVRTDAPVEPGDEVTVALSFPGLVEPVELSARVVDTRASAGPGEPGGWILSFDPGEPGARARLQALLQRAAEGESMRSDRVRYRVLLVEDNRLTREVFAYGVERYFADRESPVAVDVAEDGQQAWAMLCTGGYDLAIVDFYLPLLAGDELIERMRQDPRLQSLAIVAVSAGGDDARNASMSAGADLFLDKPVVLRDLFTTLERLTMNAGPA